MSIEHDSSSRLHSSGVQCGVLLGRVPWRNPIYPQYVRTKKTKFNDPLGTDRIRTGIRVTTGFHAYFRRTRKTSFTNHQEK